MCEWCDNANFLLENIKNLHSDSELLAEICECITFPFKNIVYTNDTDQISEIANKWKELYIKLNAELENFDTYNANQNVFKTAGSILDGLDENEDCCDFAALCTEALSNSLDYNQFFKAENDLAFLYVRLINSLVLKCFERRSFATENVLRDLLTLLDKLLLDSYQRTHLFLNIIEPSMCWMLKIFDVNSNLQETISTLWRTLVSVFKKLDDSCLLNVLSTYREAIILAVVHFNFGISELGSCILEILNKSKDERCIKLYIDIQNALSLTTSIKNCRRTIVTRLNSNCLNPYRKELLSLNVKKEHKLENTSKSKAKNINIKPRNFRKRKVRCNEDHCYYEEDESKIKQLKMKDTCNNINADALPQCSEENVAKYPLKPCYVKVCKVNITEDNNKIVSKIEPKEEVPATFNEDKIKSLSELKNFLKKSVKIHKDYFNDDESNTKNTYIGLTNLNEEKNPKSVNQKEQILTAIPNSTSIEEILKECDVNMLLTTISKRCTPDQLLDTYKMQILSLPAGEAKNHFCYFLGLNTEEQNFQKGEEFFINYCKKERFQSLASKFEGIFSCEEIDDCIINYINGNKDAKIFNRVLDLLFKKNTADTVLKVIDETPVEVRNSIFRHLCSLDRVKHFLKENLTQDELINILEVVKKQLGLKAVLEELCSTVLSSVS